ncbi:PhzF family phenazine biosynthesis protein [Aureimonas ureilytica]|uniref:PhzF family phenazine biosynthesis protein n=1 Tax=Aureimonas ureilytica TaxID=401562 RepID=UPI002378225C|nr:PhzF family phenazine biosynthesis protein [Aureimonas ureilytica]
MGGPFVHAFQTSRRLFVELSAEQAVQQFVPDLTAIETLHPRSFVVTAPGNEHGFVSRHFAPGAGVPEDSVTGSTHSTLIPYWSRKLGKDRMTAFQCSPRGGRLSCELSGDRVRIVGQAVTYLCGSVVIPEGSYLEVPVKSGQESFHLVWSQVIEEADVQKRSIRFRPIHAFQPFQFLLRRGQRVSPIGLEHLTIPRGVG